MAPQGSNPPYIAPGCPAAVVLNAARTRRAAVSQIPSAAIKNRRDCSAAARQRLERALFGDGNGGGAQASGALGSLLRQGLGADEAQ